MVLRQWMLGVLSAACVAGVPAPSEAGKVNREADCLSDKTCVEQYQKEKQSWLVCLDQEAGLSEKKRQKLALKVEALGIRNLKKQEILIFNSRRKKCHKQFKESLAHIQANPESKDPRQWPPPIDGLQKRLEE